MNGCGIVAVGLLLLGFAPLVRAVNFTLPATEDTYICINDAMGGPDSSHGSQASLEVIGVGGWYTKSLVRFTVADAGGMFTVGSTATVRMRVEARYPGTSNSISVAASLVAWNESSTWNSLSGGSYGPALSTVDVSWNNDPRYVDWTIPASLVDQWMHSPATNLGLVFYSNSASHMLDKVFSSREGANPPLLIFDTVPEPVSALLLIGGCGAMLGRRRRT